MAKTTKKQASSTPSAMGAAPGESPWPKRLGIGVGVIVVLGLVALMLFNANPVSGVPEGTQTIALGPPEHIEGDIYAANEVPAGGPHAPIWLNCGFYDAPVSAENVGHSLEHGAVWLTHLPDLPSDQVGTLRGFTGGVDKIIVSPVPGQSAPVIATAWGVQLELADTDDPRLAQFVNEFKRGRGAPEQGALCSGGVGTPTG